MFRVVRDWVGLASGQFTASDGNRQVPCQSIAVMIIGPISCRGYPLTWWRHQMETFSALLAICAGNSPVTGEFPAQRPVTQSFFFLSVPEWTVEYTIGRLMIWDAIAPVMTSQWWTRCLTCIATINMRIIISPQYLIQEFVRLRYVCRYHSFCRCILHYISDFNFYTVQVSQSCVKCVIFIQMFVTQNHFLIRRYGKYHFLVTGFRHDWQIYLHAARSTNTC